jgi:hypothetical protein
MVSQELYKLNYADGSEYIRNLVKPFLPYSLVHESFRVQPTCSYPG